MCARSDEPREPELRPGEEVRLAIDEAMGAFRGGPGPNLTFTDAEAFLHPELPALITHAVEAGAQRVGITTSGVAFTQGGNAAGCIHVGVRHVDVVLLGGRDTHDSLVGTSGSYEAAKRGLEAFQGAAADAGVRVAVMGHVPVCKHNVHEIPDAVATFVEMGAIGVHLQPHRDLDVKRHVEWFGAAFQTGIMHGVWVCAEPTDLELFGKWALHVGDPCHVGGASR